MAGETWIADPDLLKVNGVNSQCGNLTMFTFKREELAGSTPCENVSSCTLLGPILLASRLQTSPDSCSAGSSNTRAQSRACHVMSRLLVRSAQRNAEQSLDLSRHISTVHRFCMSPYTLTFKEYLRIDGRLGPIGRGKSDWLGERCDM